MNEWARSLQTLVDEIDRCIKQQDDDALTLARLSERMGYSRFYVSRQFRAISGMQLGEYLRNRRLAFALREVRDSESKLLDIAVKYGFSSHEAFTRAFKAAYGVRLPMDYDGGIPPQMRMMDVPEGEYIVFEHGPFDFETENAAVEAQIEQAMKDFDYEKSGYRLDLTPERVFYFFHDCKRYWKYVRPVVRKESDTSKQV